MDDRNLLAHDATGLSHLVRTGEVSAGELLDATRARIDRLDGDINAVITDCRDRARGRLADVTPDAPFAGVPTLLKDLVDLEGVRRTDGSRSMLDNVSPASPSYVEALERAGLVVAGKTNTPEFASLPVTDNDAFGPTRNPWDLDRSAGGSSGGAAAAVAAGYTPLVHGTDGGGSNRIPASWCGVLGTKPSRGRLASGELDGTHPLFKTHHAISRTVRDSAALFLATQSTDGNPFPHVETLGPSDRRLRIAVTLEDPYGTPPAEAIRAAVEDTARLCEELGHEVTAVPNPVDGPAFFTMYSQIFLSRTIGLVERIEQASGMPIEESQLLSAATIDLVRRSDALPADALEQDDAHLQRLTRDLDAFYSTHDVWLTPVTSTEPTPIGEFSPSTPSDPERSHRALAHLAFVNAHGGAAMSIPASWDEATGLPTGVHISAAPGGDELLYGLAYEFEEARPWAHRWAPHSAMRSEA